MHVIEHVLGNAQLRDPNQELPSTYPIVRYAGQPVAAVAAVSQADRESSGAEGEGELRARSRSSSDRDDAQKADAPLVFQARPIRRAPPAAVAARRTFRRTGNVRGPVPSTKPGIPRKASPMPRSSSRREYRTQVQTHSALETHGVVADWKPDVLTVYASTQGTASVRDELAEIFSLPREQGPRHHRVHGRRLRREVRRRQ